MRILIATDAWYPQINGVVRTLSSLASELRRRGIEVRILSPDDFRTVPCPTYPEIRLALPQAERVRAIIRDFEPHAIHIATEGPVGLQARHVARQLKRPFTTSFHTRFPEYVRERAPVPERLTYAALRWFHNGAAACLVSTDVLRRELRMKGFDNLVTWSRGVDRTIFRPLPPIALGLPGPIFLTVSRIAPEKNLQAFLDLDLPGSKVVVGDGPLLPALIRAYPEVHFAGAQSGDTLARYYSSADVFVFPSRSDTFGLVLIEALACGVPVAAFLEPGPMDVIAGTRAGCVSEDLRVAALSALSLSRADALERATAFGWDKCADVFLRTLMVDEAPTAAEDILPQAA